MNPNSKQSYLLTEDSYFDYNPSYSSVVNKIVFESKRIDANNELGLSNKTNIFFYDIFRKKIEILTDKKFINRLREINNYFQISNPVFDETGNKLCIKYNDVINERSVDNYFIYDIGCG